MTHVRRLKRFALRGAYALDGTSLCGRSCYSRPWGLAWSLNSQFTVRFVRRTA